MENGPTKSITMISIEKKTATTTRKTSYDVNCEDVQMEFNLILFVCFNFFPFVLHIHTNTITIGP